MILADEIRDFVNSTWIEPERKAGNDKVILRSGDIHSRMGLKDRMPAVCGALDAKIFETNFRVCQNNRKGPTHSSTVEWTFSILP